MTYTSDGTLRCDMDQACVREVTHLDEGGFVYCADHGRQRRPWKRCRKLRPAELRRLRAGLRLERY